MQSSKNNVNSEDVFSVFHKDENSIPHKNYLWLKLIYTSVTERVIGFHSLQFKVQSPLLSPPPGLCFPPGRVFSIHSNSRWPSAAPSQTSTGQQNKQKGVIFMGQSVTLLWRVGLWWDNSPSRRCETARNHAEEKTRGWPGVTPQGLWIGLINQRQPPWV